MVGEESGEVDPGTTITSVVSSVDGTDSHDQFIIADISCDDRWLGIRQTEAPSLRKWR